MLFASQHFLEASVCLIVLLLTHMQHHAKVATDDPWRGAGWWDEWEGAGRPSM